MRRQEKRGDDVVVWGLIMNSQSGGTLDEATLKCDWVMKLLPGSPQSP